LAAILPLAATSAVSAATSTPEGVVVNSANSHAYELVNGPIRAARTSPTRARMANGTICRMLAIRQATGSSAAI
jgi:hypothetical protein